MNTKQVTRSSITEMIVDSRHDEGVGARHKQSTSPRWGGGYLDICTDLDVSEKKSHDPRLDELVDMGVSGFWRSLASDIGFDAFIVVWRRLSSQAGQCDDGNRVYVPKYDSFSRYQRNRFILSLSQQGYSKRDIRLRIMAELNEQITTDHITKIIRTKASK